MLEQRCHLLAALLNSLVDVAVAYVLEGFFLAGLFALADVVETFSLSESVEQLVLAGLHVDQTRIDGSVLGNGWLPVLGLFDQRVELFAGAAAISPVDNVVLGLGMRQHQDTG